MWRTSTFNGSVFDTNANWASSSSNFYPIYLKIQVSPIEIFSSNILLCKVSTFEFQVKTFCSQKCSTKSQLFIRFRQAKIEIYLVDDTYILLTTLLEGMECFFFSSGANLLYDDSEWIVEIPKIEWTVCVSLCTIWPVDPTHWYRVWGLAKKCSV